jgi:hypothetical protein
LISFDSGNCVYRFRAVSGSELIGPVWTTSLRGGVIQKRRFAWKAAVLSSEGAPFEAAIGNITLVQRFPRSLLGSVGLRCRVHESREEQK